MFVHVLVADGGLLPACINAAVLALAHAGARPPAPLPRPIYVPSPFLLVRTCMCMFRATAWGKRAQGSYHSRYT